VNGRVRVRVRERRRRREKKRWRWGILIMRLSSPEAWGNSLRILTCLAFLPLVAKARAASEHM
jgi:hypothetical protein